MFTKMSAGGLGLPHPHTVYYADHLAFYLSILNCDDPYVRHTARESLTLHMAKRKIATAVIGQKSFAGFSVIGDKLDKRAKVNWPRSNWVHLFEMLNREKIELKLNIDGLYTYHVTVDDGIVYQIESPTGFSMFYKDNKYTEFHRLLLDKEVQGRITREATDIDMTSSAHVLKNHNVKDEVRSFVLKGRLQLLPCRSLLHTYYPATYSKVCSLCNHPTDTVSHALNGCTKYSSNYQARHNRIVDLVHDKVVAYNANIKVIKDHIVKPNDFIETHSPSFETQARRPDIILIDKQNRTVKIVEVQVPFDAFLKLSYQTKFEKYVPLSMEINALGFYTEIIVLIVGSLGSVHNKFSSGLVHLGLTKHEANFLTKYCSISAILGSNIVWNLMRRDAHHM